MNTVIDTVNQRIGAVPQYLFDNSVIEQVVGQSMEW